MSPALSERDRAILMSTRLALRDAPGDFSSALRALRIAVERRIPAGRTFYLGDYTFGPIIGSILSGVGIAQDVDGIVVVRARHGAPISRLGRLVP
ncbi:MAG: hypothetical protein R3B09_20975 [Nannocystaceae bacterium]